MEQGLRDEIARLAATPILLVACDFDGTIAAMADHPDLALADEQAVEWLRVLAEMESTHVAMISGRSLASLRERLGALCRSPDVILVGGHGAEMPGEHGGLPPPEDAALRALVQAMEAVAAEYPGAMVEIKPTGVALHYRHVVVARHAGVRRAAIQAAQSLECPLLREGVLVVEAGLIGADKGSALRWAMERVNAHAALFVGDDATDEDAFAVLRSQDVGVKVGPGLSIAGHRVPDHESVRGLLAALVEVRREGLQKRRLTPIDSLAMLSDQRACALVDPAGRVCWMGAPKYDSSPLFAHLLGGDGAGYFHVAPADGRAVLRRGYEGDTMILRTEYDGLVVRDYMDCSAGRAYQRAGRTDLVRALETTGGGAVRVMIRFAPRIDFGRMPTRLHVAEGGLVVEGGGDPTALYAPGVQWTVQDEGGSDMALGLVEVGSRGLLLELRVGTAALKSNVAGGPRGAGAGASSGEGGVGASGTEAKRRGATEKFWSGWAATLKLPARHAELVKRSALVIKSLCYGPTGAICAAATTSLPEQIGGVRNWDYRFCWVRDAAMSCGALVRLGSTGHALKYLDWLGAIIEDLPGPEQLRPIYTVRGAELGAEGEISSLNGYGDSRPVRVGNGAAHQVQLDVFGAVADLIGLLAEAGAPLTPEHWRMLDAMVRAVANRWREPDHGIWEMRGPMRQHVHSKAMCWFTVARAVRAREIAGEAVRPEDVALADAIRADVLAKGYSEAKACFTAAYGQPRIDAACLLVGLTGLVEASDPRFVGTVERVKRELFEGGSVLRYRYEDGLPGVEGGFHLCTGWLIESLHMMGRVEEATSLLDEYAAQAGPLGLYAEERCTVTGRALGNYPQAYSHLALINACCRVAPG